MTVLIFIFSAFVFFLNYNCHVFSFLCVFFFKFCNVTLTLKITIHVCNHLWSTEFYANYMVGNKERREADPGEEI